jgi:hypothetical protein
MLITHWLSLFHRGLESTGERRRRGGRTAAHRGFPADEFTPVYATRYSTAHWTRARMRHHLRPRQRLA